MTDRHGFFSNAAKKDRKIETGMSIAQGNRLLIG
jgi:hypothetical protein